MPVPMASLLADELDLQPNLSHSASSLLPLSTDNPSTSSDLIPQKSQRRLSLGVLNSSKFRFSHDVRPGPRVRAILTIAFYPHSCLTRVVRTPFFSSLHVSSGHPALSLQSQLRRAEQS
jgi:hypothetical protein